MIDSNDPTVAKNATVELARLRAALEPFVKFAKARLEAFGPNSFQSYLTPMVHADHGKIYADITRPDWDRAIDALSTPPAPAASEAAIRAEQRQKDVKIARSYVGTGEICWQAVRYAIAAAIERGQSTEGGGEQR